MIRLGVNVDHVATVRQARRTVEPDPVAAAVLAELGGADQITIHLREDRRHIQDRDLQVLRRTVQTQLNLEMALNDEIIGIAVDTVPEQCTFVPEKREEVTTEGGLDVLAVADRLTPAVARLKEAGVLVSLFVDPEAEIMEACARSGADSVELHTGSYANARGQTAVKAELEKLQKSSAAAAGAGLKVFAGHGLNYLNTPSVVAIPQVEEVNIGHSIISRAVLVGMERAVREMKALLKR
ncbi:MAG: pyridoxine 5'-phosphate synthase [Candidatus Glassbacteria bacterium]|nr:pyridoxine 5'-phosphate synthase [Candidatus Glassbacteria bacterium]